MPATRHLTPEELLALSGPGGRTHAHLAGCPACAARLADLQGDLARLAPAPVRPAPGGVRRVLRLAARRQRARRAVVSGIVGAVAAFALWAVVLNRPVAPRPAVVLSGTSWAPAASARIVVLPSGRGVFTASHLPALPSGRVYELWTIEGGDHRRAAVFTPDAGGSAHITIALPADLAGVSFGVTVEPAPGTTRPTGRRVLRAQI